MQPIAEPIPVHLRPPFVDLTLTEQEAEVVLSALLLFQEVPDSLLTRVSDVLRVFGSRGDDVAATA